MRDGIGALPASLFAAFIDPLFWTNALHAATLTR
jgi:hypothetical protein